MGDLRIKTASDSSILTLVGDTPDGAVQRRVATLTRNLLRLRDPRIRNIHPAYASILIDFDPLRVTHHEIVSLVREIDYLDDAHSLPEPSTVEIAVCYEPEFGLDLDDVAKELGTSVEEVIHRHSSGTYNVSFFGFSPGFAYLGGLTESLHVARLGSPRRLVQAGSVAIAAQQTGVYSVDSPGGWRLLGKTPMRMFDPNAERPSPLEIGDSVRFVPISREEFHARESVR